MAKTFLSSICQSNKTLFTQTFNFWNSKQSTTLLRSFHHLMNAGMKHLEYCAILHLTNEEEWQWELKAYLFSRTDWNKLGSSRWREWAGLWWIFEEHAQTSYGIMVPQVNIKIRDQNLTSCRNKTWEQYLKQDKKRLSTLQ